MNSRNVSELYKAKCAAVMLMDSDEEQTPRFLRLGEFVVNLMVQAFSPIMMTACMVDGWFQWPITKDAPIVRIGLRTFAFAMPGILYGLQFPTNCDDDMMDRLERIFVKFGNYNDLKDKRTGYPWADNAPDFWRKLRPQIEQIANVTLTRFGHMPGRSPSAVGDQASGILKALRTSATTKMIASAIVSRSLKPMHAKIYGTMSRHHQVYSNQAFLSISAITNIVEACELAWVLKLGNEGLLRERVVGPAQPTGWIMWKLSEQGIGFFLEELLRVAKLEEENVSRIRNFEQDEGSSKDGEGDGSCSRGN